MDWLLERQAKIEAQMAAHHLRDGALVLYDVSSTYFEGRTCPLARLGHNRDGKKGKLQIVFGVLCTGEGCPVAVEVFELAFRRVPRRFFGNFSARDTTGRQRRYRVRGCLRRSAAG